MLLWTQYRGISPYDVKTRCSDVAAGPGQLVPETNMGWRWVAIGAAFSWSLGVDAFSGTPPTSTALVIRYSQRQQHPNGSPGGPKLSADPTIRQRQMEFLQRQGFVYDSLRQTWTRPPNGKPKRRPVLVRSVSSNRVLEIVLSESASEETTRKAVDALKAALREAAEIPRSTRFTLETIGIRLVAGKQWGSWALLSAQLFLWSFARSHLTLEALPPVELTEWTVVGVAGCAIVFAWLTQDSREAGFARASALTGALERVAADTARGAHALPAPRSWRADDALWRIAAAILDLAAAFPRCLAFHAAMQAPIDTEVYRRLPDDAVLAATVAVAAVAAFAAVCDFLAVDQDEQALCDAEVAALTEAARRASDTDDDILYARLADAWVKKFSKHQRRPPVALISFMRTATIATAYRISGDRIATPLAMHAVAGLIAVVAPARYEDDPDRAIYHVR